MVRTPPSGPGPNPNVPFTGLLGGVVEGGAYGTPPQAHSLGSDPSVDGEVPEEVDLANLWKVSGHPYSN
jgi:hypothetical protein